MNKRVIFGQKISRLLITVSVIITVIFPIASVKIKAQGSLDFLDIKVETIDGKTVNVKWLTSQTARGKIVFGKTKDNFPYFVEDTHAPDTMHETILGGLDPKATYYFQIIAASEFEQAYSFVKSFKTGDFNDKFLPEIDNLRVPYVGGTVAVFTWETDKETNAKIDYDESASYRRSGSGPSGELSHRLVITNLKPNTYYYFRVSSTDKFGNKSSYWYKEFQTLPDDNAAREDLTISYVRPSGPDDSYISDKSVIVSFKTNHYAKGQASLSGGSRYQTKSLDYDFNHQVIFTELTPDKQYTLYISATDVFNKRADVRDLKFKTRAVAVAAASPTVASAGYTLGSGSCRDKILSGEGYYGQYYTLPESLPNLNEIRTKEVGQATGWYDKQYFTLWRLESDLNFGNAFFPLSGGKLGEPKYFSAYWRAMMEVPADGSYSYQIKSDDDSWVFIDGKLISDVGGIHTLRGDSPSPNLSKGFHALEVYFAQRRLFASSFVFILDKRIKVHPWPPECAGLGGEASGSFPTGQGAAGKEATERVIVSGAEFSLYTRATALLKTVDSPDVYVILNGQRHYISSPASFNEYGYRWSDIKTVDWTTLLKYPRARLLKNPDNPTVYYLYQRPEKQWLKINLPSPTVFVSYPQNYWGNIITVTQLDINAYPDVKLIKTADGSEIYYLENNVKHSVSAEAFERRNFRQPEIAEVSRIHLDTYKTGAPLE